MRNFAVAQSFFCNLENYRKTNSPFEYLLNFSANIEAVFLKLLATKYVYILTSRKKQMTSIVS